MPVVVSDTSPIRALVHLDLLNLLADLFGEVLIPPAVEGELRHPRSGWPIVDVRALPFVKVRTPGDLSRIRELRKELDLGESEALALALEVKADLVLMDEATGREAARRLGLHPLGVLGLLIQGKTTGRLKAVRPLVERLRAEIDFFVSESLLARVLRAAGE